MLQSLSETFSRKEVIQSHLPVRLPCYDFTPVMKPTVGAAFTACTPVPGGIGSVTTALLLRHTVQAAEKSHHF